MNYIKIAMLLCIFTTLSADQNLVKIRLIDPSIIIDLRYATPYNFTNHQVYPDYADAYLLEFVAHQLSLVQNYLKQKGLGLKIWDAYRPLSAQWKFWELFPDERYVSNPAKGGRHTRGTTVDVTLIYLADSKELCMPTEFDNFTEKAHADCIDLPQEAIFNREILRQAMELFGFKGIQTEWWHFDMEDWTRYPVLDIEFDELAKK
jgi:D-alanyl-D-alanine dipeptidase